MNIANPGGHWIPNVSIFLYQPAEFGIRGSAASADVGPGLCWTQHIWTGVRIPCACCLSMSWKQKVRRGFTSSVSVICSPTCQSVQAWSGAALTGFLPSLPHLWLSLVAAAQGETGLSEGEWRAKPVLTQHLKPPHKYRLPFPISKQPIYLCLHASTLLHVMCWGVSLKMTLGHLAGFQRAGLWCAVVHFGSLQPLIHRATAIRTWPGVISFKPIPLLFYSCFKTIFYPVLLKYFFHCKCHMTLFHCIFFL